MHWFDILILLIMGIAVAYSAVKGFVRELFVMIGLVLGYLITVRYFEPLALAWDPDIGDRVVTRVLAVLVLFVSTFAVVWLIGYGVCRFVSGMKLGSLDRLLGALFGLIKGIVIVALVLMLLFTFTALGSTIASESLLAPSFVWVARQMARALPDRFLHEPLRWLPAGEEGGALERSLTRLKQGWAEDRVERPGIVSEPD